MICFWSVDLLVEGAQSPGLRFRHADIHIRDGPRYHGGDVESRACELHMDVLCFSQRQVCPPLDLLAPLFLQFLSRLSVSKQLRVRFLLDCDSGHFCDSHRRLLQEGNPVFPQQNVGERTPFQVLPD